jgi:hypothetical protein
LPEREDAVISFLRTATDAQGNRFFLGSAVGAQQLHLFDSNWKRMLSFPETGDHPGIADALLADFDGDGKLEVAVGYVEHVGVHCFSLDGDRLWRNRAAEHVFRLGQIGPDPSGKSRLLATTMDGVVVPIDSEGREDAPVVLPQGAVRRFVVADLDGDDLPEWCAVVQILQETGEPGPEMVVGISSGGTGLWSYHLPSRLHSHAAFESLVAGDLLGGETAQWVVAAADGSIHILAIDGTLIDEFNYGASPNALAVFHVDGRSALCVSSADGVEALQFESPR